MTYHILLFVHSSVDGHLGCFLLLTIMDNAAMNTHVQVFVKTHALNSFGFKPRSRIPVIYSNSMLNPLKKC